MTGPWLHRFAVLTAACTLVLIGIGGLVTSHGVGMAVPDWPTTYGYNMFYFPVSSWVGGIFYEHSHRLWASWVGLLTLVLAAWLNGRRAVRWVRGLSWVCLAVGLAGLAGLWRGGGWLGLSGQLVGVGFCGLLGARRLARIEPAGKRLRWLGTAALGAVVFQGVLGGLRVVWYRDQIGIFHATLAQIFLVMVCLIAVFTSDAWSRLSAAQVVGGGLGRARACLTIAAVLVLLQLVLGAAMRHQHAGLAVPDFPLAYGRVWPPMDEAFVEQVNRGRLDVRDYKPITGGQIALHMAHRVGALGILAVVLGLVWRCRRCGWGGPWLRRRVGFLGLLIVAQAGLGALTVWSNKAADVATAHVLLGAVSFAVISLLMTAVWKFSVEADGALLHSRTAFCGPDGVDMPREASIAR